MSLKLTLNTIADQPLRENLRRLQSYLNDLAVDKGQFQFFLFAFAKATTRQALPHKLGFQPLDVLQLSVRASDTALVTWHYDSFTPDNIVISTDGPCTVRAYIGRYGEGL